MNHPQAWPIQGVRVEDDKVIVAVKGGNDAARQLCGELVALIDGQQARAALSAPAVPEWLPIETAPKDVPVIGFWPQLPQHHPCRHHKGYWVIEVSGDRQECARPTHWIPLPPPPAAPQPQEPRNG